MKTKLEINQHTRAEIYFLLRLGKGQVGRYGFVGTTKPLSRVEHLRRYKLAAELRSDWGKIDKEVLLSLLNLMIEEEVLKKASNLLAKLRGEMATSSEYKV